MKNASPPTAATSVIEHPGRPALAGMLVAELGERTGCAICTSLLAQLGATVVVVEPASPRFDAGSLSDKWNWRAQMMAGKLSMPAADRAAVAQLVACADVLVTSSDWDASDLSLAQRPARQIHCDITAWGADAQEAACCEVQMQALTGILATTGLPDGDAMPAPVPLLETLCGVNAAGAILAAWRHVQRTGGGQQIDMALYDSGFAAMSSFFSRLLVDAGGAGGVRRMGNQHTLSAPWNVYKASDGWILICTGSNDQWRRLCVLMGQEALAQDARYLHPQDRVAHVDEVDALVQAWAGARTSRECVSGFAQASIPGGPVATIDLFPREPNLEHRQMVQALDPRPGQEPFYIAASPLWMSRTAGKASVCVPLPGQDAAQVTRLLHERDEQPAHALAQSPRTAQPLAGLRIVEIGHYTTAPVAARHLAALGAEVVKVEPPDGEAARSWAPLQQGQSVFYTVSNSGKQGVTLDLSTQQGCDELRELLTTADVLVENLKPGTLAKRGFAPAQLAQAYPRLVICAISGFGADSIYAARPAFDTVVQGMSGLMHLIRSAGIPLKTGISTADVMGAAMAMVAILGALQEREHSGRGQFIDLSMQDIVAWATQTRWNGWQPGAAMQVLHCADGDLLAIGAAPAASSPPASREQMAEHIRQAGGRSAPVLAPAEVLASPQTARRRLHFRVTDARGQWPALAVPMRLLGTPAQVTGPGPQLGADNDALLGTARRASIH